MCLTPSFRLLGMFVEDDIDICIDAVLGNKDRKLLCGKLPGQVADDDIDSGLCWVYLGWADHCTIVEVAWSSFYVKEL